MKKLFISIMSVMLIVSTAACSRKSEEEVAKEKAAEVVKETEELVEEIVHTSGQIASETSGEAKEITEAAFNLIETVLANIDSATSEITRSIQNSDDVEEIESSTEIVESINKYLKTILSEVQDMQKDAANGKDISKAAMEIIEKTASEIDIDEEEFDKLFSEAMSTITEIQNSMDFSNLPTDLDSKELEEMMNQMQEQLDKLTN